MENRSIILNELKEISPIVAQAGNTVPYNIPQGYFEGLAEMVLKRIKTETLGAKDEVEVLSPLLSGLNRKMPYEVPAGYFDEDVSPILMSLKSKNVYEVPQGYFENFADNVLAKVTERQPAKVVSMGRRFMRYAAAAVIAGALAIGGWFYLNNNSGEDFRNDVVEKLSKDTKVSEDEMADFLENESIPAVVLNTSITDDTNVDMDETDVKEMLSDVSEDELQQFLKTL